MSRYFDKYRGKEIKITLEQMEFIDKLENKTDRKIAFVFNYMHHVFADENGEFNATHKTIAYLANCSIRQEKKLVPLLVDLKYIKYVHHDKLKPIESGLMRKHSVNKFPNRYKLDLLKADSKEVFYKFKFEDIYDNEKNILIQYYNCYDKFYEYNQTEVTRRVMENIERYVG